MHLNNIQILGATAHKRKYISARCTTPRISATVLKQWTLARKSRPAQVAIHKHDFHTIRQVLLYNLQPALERTQLPVQWFPWGKAERSSRPSSEEVNNNLELRIIPLLPHNFMACRTLLFWCGQNAGFLMSQQVVYIVTSVNECVK